MLGQVRWVQSCLRDHDGRCRAASAIWYERAQDALTMEAMACRLGLQLAQQGGISKVCLETDCLELIKPWKRLDEQRSGVSFILYDIRALSTSFVDFSFTHVSRYCNRGSPRMCSADITGATVGGVADQSTDGSA